VKEGEAEEGSEIVLSRAVATEATGIPGLGVDRYASAGWRSPESALEPQRSATSPPNPLEDEPDAPWVTELWADQAAHQASLQNKRDQVDVQQGISLVAGMPEQIRLTPIGARACPDLNIPSA
jgi:hypothetical protein